MIAQFLCGAIFIAAAMTGLYFARFWQETNDRFFLFFSIAFGLLAVERVPLALKIYSGRRNLSFI